MDREREMAAVQWYRQAFTRGSQLWITYSPSRPLLRRAEPIIRGFIDALWISEKPLTLPRAWLVQQLEALGVLTDMQWGIYALYESMSGKVRSSKGLSKAVASTIGVKQRCPLSPTLFGLYIDEVSHYIERFGGSGARLASLYSYTNITIC